MMSTDPDPRQLHAFADGELDLAGQLGFEARLRQDAALRGRLARLHALREAVRSGADYHAAPPALREQVRALARMRTASAPPRSAAWQRWFAWRPLAASSVLVALLAAGPGLWLLQDQREERLGEDVVASHVRASLTQRQVDIASSDHHAVKPWLSARLDFSPPVPQPPGPVLVGGRVDYVGGRPVAALVYRHAGHVVDAYAWPATGGSRGLALRMEHGFRLAHWTRDGMEHWVVSDLNAGEFAQLVAQLRSAE